MFIQVFSIVISRNYSQRMFWATADPRKSRQTSCLSFSRRWRLLRWTPFQLRHRMGVPYCSSWMPNAVHWAPPAKRWKCSLTWWRRKVSSLLPPAGAWHCWNREAAEAIIQLPKHGRNFKYCVYLNYLFSGSGQVKPRLRRLSIAE